MALRAERDHGPVVPADDVRDHVVGLEAATEPLELCLRHAAEKAARLVALHQRADRIRATSTELRQPLRQLLPRAANLAGRAPEPSPPFAGSSKSSIVPATPQCGQVVPRRMGGRTVRNTLPMRSMGSTFLSKGRPREVVPHGGSTLPVVPVPVQRRWDGLEPVPPGGSGR